MTPTITNYGARPNYSLEDTGIPTYSKETTLFEWFIEICVAAFDDGSSDNYREDQGCMCDSLCGGSSSVDVKDTKTMFSKKAMKESDRVMSRRCGQRKSRGFRLNGAKVCASDESYYADSHSKCFVGNELSCASVKRTLSLDQKLAAKRLQNDVIPGGFHETVANYESDPGFVRIRTLHRLPSKKQDELTNNDVRSNANALDRSIDVRKADKVVTEFINMSMRLRWHHPDKRSIVEVEAWIKLGEVLPSVVIQPKLQWRESSSHGSKAVDLLRDYVDLLDVYRVFEMSDNHSVCGKINFPFARKHLSFVIQTTDDKIHLFEARTTEERDSIIMSLKTTVSTLSSRLFLHDKTAYDDFFSSRSKYLMGSPCMS